MQGHSPDWVEGNKANSVISLIEKNWRGERAGATSKVETEVGLNSTRVDYVKIIFKVLKTTPSYIIKFLHLPFLKYSLKNVLSKKLRNHTFFLIKRNPL